MNSLREDDSTPSPGSSRAARMLAVLLALASIVGGVLHYLGIWS